MKKMLMIYEGKEEPIDSIDFDIVANEMEEEVEDENENTMVANEDEDYETPEEMKERKKEESRREKHYNSIVNYFKETKTMRYL